MRKTTGIFLFSCKFVSQINYYLESSWIIAVGYWATAQSYAPCVIK
jgi:hypothetical protein